MKAAAQAARDMSQGKAYLGQAEMYGANAARTNLGTNTLSRGLASGEITPYAVGRLTYGIGGDASTPEELSARAQQKNESQAASDRYKADSEARWHNYLTDAKERWENYNANHKGGRSSGGANTDFNFGKISDNTFQEILTDGARLLEQMYPDATGIREADNSVNESAAMALQDAYRIGMKITKPAPDGTPPTMVDVLRTGLNYLSDNNKLGVSEVVIPGKKYTGLKGLIKSDEPDTKVWQLSYPYRPPVNDGSNFMNQAPSLNNQQQLQQQQQQQPSPTEQQSTTQPVTPPQDAQPQLTPEQIAEKKAKTMQSIIDETRQIYQEMLARRTTPKDTGGLGDALVGGVTPDNILESAAKKGLQTAFNIPYNIGKYVNSLPKGSLADTLESQAQQAISPRMTPTQQLISHITFKLKAAGYNDPAQIKQLVSQIIQEIQRTPYNGFQ